MQTIKDAYAEVVQESLDTNLKLTKVPEESMLHVMGSMSAAMVGGTNFSMHHMGKDNGYMIQMDKDGATELHHVNDDLRGGFAENKKPSFGFVSTFKKRIKEIVDSGKTVRLVAHDAIKTPVKNISDRLISKNPEYSSTEPKSITHELTGDPMTAWEISKKS